MFLNPNNFSVSSLVFAVLSHLGHFAKTSFVFSDEKKLLIDLAKSILEKYGLFNAKVPSYDTPRQSENGGFGFVLCVYDTSPKLKHELKQYGNNKTIHYRYWKSDKATLEGKYSKQFTAKK